MSTDKGPDQDELLNTTLRQWRVELPLPPRFQEQVWQRIARAETPAEAGVWAAFSRAIEGVVPRPRFAVAYLAALLVVGLIAGSVSAQIRTSRLNSELGQRYVQSIDPNRAGITLP